MCAPPPRPLHGSDIGTPLGDMLQVGHVQGLVDMQRTRVPVGVLPAIIVNPVGGIGILLDLRNDNALSNRMERTGLE